MFLSQIPTPAVHDVPALKRSTAGYHIIPTLFAVFFVQLIVLIGVSFIFQYGPVFVVRKFFGLDYYDFYIGVSHWLSGINPYALGRLYTPPSSLWVGLLFHLFPFNEARLIFFVLNIVLILLSLKVFSKEVGLQRWNEIGLIGTTVLFYPFYFLVERGNLDGIMLALLVWGFRSRSKVKRSLLLGLSAATKLYTCLMLPILVRKREFKVALMSILFAGVAQLPFFALIPRFIEALSGRSSQLRVDENISPAVISSLLLGNFGNIAWKVVFVTFWAVTLLIRLRRDHSDTSVNWPTYVPWMISFPALVYPYSGVLALCLVALIASACQTREITQAELLVVFGFGLLGFQAVAWTFYLSMLLPVTPMVHIIPPVGVLMMIVGAVNLPSYSRESVIEKPKALTYFAMEISTKQPSKSTPS